MVSVKKCSSLYIFSSHPFKNNQNCSTVSLCICGQIQHRIFRFKKKLSFHTIEIHNYVCYNNTYTRIWWNWQTRQISLMLPRCKNFTVKKSDSKEPDLYKCRYGETGKHAGFRIQWSNPCRFKSCYLHQRLKIFEAFFYNIKRSKTIVF